MNGATNGDGAGVGHQGIPLRRAEGLVLVMDTPKGCNTSDPAYFPLPVQQNLESLFVHITDDSLLGRGVFAGRDIPASTVLEVSPVLVLDPIENQEHIKKTELYNYT
jgi:uncharacterized protein